MRILLNHSQAKILHQCYPDHVGVLFSPERTRHYPGVPFAIDNGAFGAWKRGDKWDELAFCRVVEKYAAYHPLFVVAPDVISDKDKTLTKWEDWSSWIHSLGIAAAFVFTDGMDLADVPKDADYIFIGGSNLHIERAIKLIPEMSKPVHVGRVNHHNRLWKSHNYGAISCDGTGWFRGDNRQYQVLRDYLRIKSGEQKTESNMLFHIGAYCQ